MKTSVGYFAVITLPTLLWGSGQTTTFAGTTAIIGWFGIVAAVALIAILSGRVRRNLTLLLSGKDPVARLMRTMLLASAIIPIASDAIASLGNAASLYGASSIADVHVVIVTLVFVAITLEVDRLIHHLDIQRRDALALAQSSEARLRLQVDHMPAASVSCSTDFLITSWNHAAERIFGWTDREMLGRPITELLPGGLTDGLEDVQSRLLAGEVLHHTNEHRRKDGQTIVCRWSCAPLKDASGALAVIIGMAEDITDDLRTEAALRQSEERYRQLVDNLPHYIYSVDNDDRYTAMNSAAARALGLTPEAVIGKTPLEIGVPSDLAAEWTTLFEATRSRGVTRTTEDRRPLDGGFSVVKTTTAPVRNEHDQIIGVTGLSVDVTALNSAEATTRRLMRAIEQLDEVVFTTSSDGVITYANPAFERLYGYTREEILDKTPRILKSGDLTDDYYGDLWSDLLSGLSRRIECRNRRKDGSLVDVVGTASPLFEVDGKISGFIAVQQDVTEQKRADEERRHLDEHIGRLAKMEALGTLAGGIAHDFNNILSIVLTHASLIQRRQDDETRVARAVETITQAVRRGASLSRQILTFARRAEINVERIDVGTVLVELASMLRETFPRTVRFALDLEPSLPFIRADSGQLHQALLNLCINARDAMPDGGEIALEARVVSAKDMKAVLGTDAPVDHVRIAVRDTGTGMDEDTRRHIFEPFFTTKEKGKGTGLGLAMVYGIVRNHGGWIDADTQLGRGTTFRLYFPIAPSNSEPERDGVRGENIGGTESLLVVDDEPQLLDSLTRHLKTLGYSVRAANNGVDAISMSRDLAPDLVLMDLGMPSMSPVELLDGLRAIGGFPIVAMTGYVDPEMHTRVIEAGVEWVVQKPFDISDLLVTVRRVLDSKGPRRSESHLFERTRDEISSIPQ
ncbi:MAG TPA: PAS domain S-box protein [Thermoanaerobaculia bacterium]|nr:PAS domain S-box protein [Thermoanaerobaculia bacterium]